MEMEMSSVLYLQVNQWVVRHGDVSFLVLYSVSTAR